MPTSHVLARFFTACEPPPRHLRRVAVFIAECLHATDLHQAGVEQAALPQDDEHSELEQVSGEGLAESDAELVLDVLEVALEGEMRER